MHSSKTYAGILDLPNELLLLILADIEPYSLYCLSFLCRRLHLLALPLYLNHEGITVTDPYDPSITNLVFASANSMKSLPALRCSLLMLSVKSIHVAFGGHADHSRVVADVHGLGLLVSKLSQLQEISIDHATVHFWTDDDWVKALGELLSVVAEKYVKTFHVSDGEQVSFPLIEIDVPKPTTRSRRPFSGLKKRIVHVKVWDYCCLPLAAEEGLSLQSSKKDQKKEQRPTYCPNPISTLENLHLESTLFFRPHLLSWTISTINSSSRSLGTLHIRKVILSTQAWTAFLPLITLHSLAKVSITSSTLLLADLFRFLSRHSNLTCLTLCDGELLVRSSQYHPFDEFPMPALPHLTTLEATPDYIAQLLEPIDAVRVKFPRLHIIGIGPFHRGYERSAVYRAIHTAFDAIARAFATSSGRKICLSLTIYGNSEFADWLIVRQHQIRPERNLNCVLGLELSTNVIQWRSNEVVALIPHWLALFPALQDVVFSGSLLSDIGVASRAAMVKQLHQACPGMQTLEMMSKKQTLDEWLAVQET